MNRYPLLFLLLLMIACRVNAQSPADPWQTLGPDIGTAKVVALGEEGHGYETYNQAKAKIFSFLYTKMDYRKLAFESSFTGCIISHLTSKTLEQRLQYFIYPFWNTVSVRSMLQPLYEEEKKSGEPSIFGLDI
jgi:erythromycin esterase-like protein